MNFFGNLFGGRGEKCGIDYCTLILLYILINNFGFNLNLGEILSSDLVKTFIILYLLSSLCGNGCDNYTRN